MLCVTNMLLHGIENPSFVRHDNTLARPYADYGPSDRVNIVLTNPPFGGQEEAGIENNFPAHFRTRETADLFLALIIRLLKPDGRAAVVLPDGTLFGEGVKTRLKEHLMEECNLHTIVRLPNSVFKPYTRRLALTSCSLRKASAPRISGSGNIVCRKAREATR
jgi:type I restriction enzyme M protein